MDRLSFFIQLKVSVLMFSSFFGRLSLKDFFIYFFLYQPKKYNILGNMQLRIVLV